MQLRRLASAVAICGPIVLAGSPGRAHAADVAPKTSIVNLVVEGQQWLMAAMAGPTAASDPTTRSATSSPDALRVPVEEGSGPSKALPFLDPSPRASVVVRDWRG